jgi:hypothetical protein
MRQIILIGMLGFFLLLVAGCDRDELVPSDNNDGDVTDSDVTDGDLTDADLTDGDLTDADITDGDLIDADLIDGDSVDHDKTDGDLDSDGGDGDEWNAASEFTVVQIDAG